MKPTRPNLTLLLALAACPPGDTPGGTFETTASTSSTPAETSGVGEVSPTEPSDSTTTSSTSDTSIGSDTTSSSSTTGPLPFCGDFTVDFPEECDDGPDGSAECSAGCQRIEDYVVFHSGARNLYFAMTLGGGVGGLRGADLVCQALAQKTGLPGRFKAWLSTAAAPPYKRFAPGAGRYVLAQHPDLVFAESWGLLLAGQVESLRGDANGALLADDDPLEVWTSTDPAGRQVGTSTCEGWTSPNGVTVRGLAAATGSPDWTHYTPIDGPPEVLCNEQRAVYCFQQSPHCGVRACVAVRSACLDQSLQIDCAGDLCETDPCAACDLALDACEAAGVECPVTRELCLELDEECGCA